MSALTALLVDDDEDQMIFVRDLLNRGPLRGCTLDWTVSGAEAIARLAHRDVDVALVDYRLGAENGLDVVRAARQAGYDTPLIVLTGQGGRTVDLAAMSAGADDFLDKLTLTSDGLERAIRYAIRDATAQRALRESEEHFRALIEHASDAILLVDATGQIRFASDSLRRVAGYSPAAVLGTHAFAHVHPEELAEVQRRFAECRQRPGAEVRTEYRSKHADGSWRVRELVAVNRLDEPAVRAVVLNYRDITDRRRAEAQRSYLASVVQSAQAAIVGMSVAGIVESWNQGAEALFGYSATEMLGQTVDRIVPEEHRAELHTLRLRIARGDHVANHLTERIRRGGDRINVSISFSPVLGSREEVIGISAVVHDVTAEQQAKRALEDSEHRYRTMFEGSPIGMAHVDLSGRWLRCNSSLVEMLGYSEEELRNSSVTDLSHAADVEPTSQLMRELIAGSRRRYEIEKRYLRKDGTYVWARAHVSLYRDSDQTPRYFISAIEDISAQRAVQEQLRGTLDRLQAIVSNLPVVLWTLDTAGVFTFAEGQLLPRFAGEGTDLVGRSLFELYAQSPEACATAERAITGAHVHVIVPIDDGRFETWYSPLHDRTGQLTGAIGIAIEITERLRLEDQFRQAQKMEAVGRLAGGVAHDFNNLLTAIIGYSELALDDVLPDPAVTGYFEEIHKAAQSAAALTRQLLAFSRQQMLQPENIDLNTVVSRTLSLLRRLIGEDIDLVTTPAANLEPVHADPTQIEQILLNLAVNARDAMPHGGRLVLETANIVIDAAFVERHPGAATGPHVMIAVSDTGVGMNNATRKRLFEPFFTTKERGRGTGLGLATVYGIVKQSGGYIGVESEPGRGAVFSIYLPAVPEVPAPLLPAAAGPQSLSGTETILVVEDQVEVRTIACQTLARYGYTVLDAASPDEAVALLASVGAHIHLLFTDVVMPQRSGRALARELLAKRPGLKVIYTSGYADSAIVNQSVLEPGLAFLPKPFSARALLLKVREVLDADQAPNV